MRLMILKSGVAVMTCAGIFTPARAESGGTNEFSVEALVQEALEKNPELNFYQVEIVAAKAGRKASGLWPNPELSGSVGQKNSRSLSSGLSAERVMASHWIGAMMRRTGVPLRFLSGKYVLWVFESTAMVWELGPTSASPSFVSLPLSALKRETPPDHKRVCCVRGAVCGVSTTGEREIALAIPAFADNEYAVIRLRTVAVLLLLALWVPATSHALLEEAGVIHTADSQHDDDHDAADGLCVSAATHVQVPQPSLTVSLGPSAEIEFWLAACAVIDGSVAEASGPSPPRAAPPELSQTWHFVSRTALPARAPSCLS